MTVENSCGAVVYTRQNGEIRYLLIQNLEGIYGFPKGHMEPNETERETALREIKEETGLTVALLPGFRTSDEHPLPNKPDTLKQIVYFLAFYENQTPVFQKEELLSAKLYAYEDAMQRFQFESSRRILDEAHEHLIKIQTKKHTRQG